MQSYESTYDRLLQYLHISGPETICSNRDRRGFHAEIEIIFGCFGTVQDCGAETFLTSSGSDFSKRPAMKFFFIQTCFFILEI